MGPDQISACVRAGRRSLLVASCSCCCVARAVVFFYRSQAARPGRRHAPSARREQRVVLALVWCFGGQWRGGDAGGGPIWAGPRARTSHGQNWRVSRATGQPARTCNYCVIKMESCIFFAARTSRTSDFFQPPVVSRAGAAAQRGSLSGAGPSALSRSALFVSRRSSFQRRRVGGGGVPPPLLLPLLLMMMMMMMMMMMRPGGRQCDQIARLYSVDRPSVFARSPRALRCAGRAPGGRVRFAAAPSAPSTTGSGRAAAPVRPLLGVAWPWAPPWARRRRARDRQLGAGTTGAN
jgi:hypothetical protein